jgi:hypothetical protein
MSYTLQDFRELTRLQLDTDADDFPDRLVDAWVREGWRFCVNHNRRWPFLRGEWSVTTTAGVGFYPVDALVGVGDVGELDGVVAATGRPLVWVGFDEAQRAFGSSDNGEPSHWSMSAAGLRLFPVPDAVQTLRVYGWVEPTDWVVGSDGGATSGLPAGFDDVILEWCIGRAFQRQEEGSLGVMHLDQADVLLRKLKSRLMPHMSSHPLILNDGVGFGGVRRAVWDV